MRRLGRALGLVVSGDGECGGNGGLGRGERDQIKGQRGNWDWLGKEIENVGETWTFCGGIGAGMRNWTCFQRGLMHKKQKFER